MFTINSHQNTIFSAFSEVFSQPQSSTLLLFTLHMTDIYLKRRTRPVAFRRLFEILGKWNNNQVTLSLGKSHEYNYRPTTVLKCLYEVYTMESNNISKLYVCILYANKLVYRKKFNILFPKLNSN